MVLWWSSHFRFRFRFAPLWLAVCFHSNSRHDKELISRWTRGPSIQSKSVSVSKRKPLYAFARQWIRFETIAYAASSILFLVFISLHRKTVSPRRFVDIALLLAAVWVVLCSLACTCVGHSLMASDDQWLVITPFTRAAAARPEDHRVPRCHLAVMHNANAHNAQHVRRQARQYLTKQTNAKASIWLDPGGSRPVSGRPLGLLSLASPVLGTSGSLNTGTMDTTNHHVVCFLFNSLQPPHTCTALMIADTKSKLAKK